MDSLSYLTSVPIDHGVELKALGSWTANNAAALRRAIGRALATSGAADIQVNVTDVAELDTFGAWLLQRLIRPVAARGREARLVGVPERYRALLEKMGEVNRRPAPLSIASGIGVRMMQGLESRLSAAFNDLLAQLSMLGAVGEVLARAAIRPRTLRLPSLVNQIDRVGWQAVPIIALITFLIGGIIAQQGIFYFRKFGAQDYVVDLTGILILRELGVLLVAIMAAGRSGSSYTAELGSMKMREEIDALRTMGRDPIEVLILPRVLALVLAMPILTFLGSMAGLIGGGFVAWVYGGLNPTIFISRVREAVSMTHFEVGMIKAPFMALVVGIVASTEGLKVKGSAESLGLQTTSSVVKSIFLVIVIDGLFAIFFASIGM